jgi:hypothetical protein
MSLDVYLTMNEEMVMPSGVFIRENGATKKITEQEWRERYPDHEPTKVVSQMSNDVYRGNITHNLNKMAKEAGIYRELWRPDEIGINKARELIAPLTDGLFLLKNEPSRFMKLNPDNGWGNYEDLVEFVEDYLSACVLYPEAEVSVSR